MTPDTTHHDAEDEYVTVTFQPQQWIKSHGDQYAENTDESWHFAVPITDVTDDTGSLITETSYAMDALQNHKNAPPTVQQWGEPFEITYDTFHEHPPEHIYPYCELVTVIFQPQIPVNGYLRIPDDVWSYNIPRIDAELPSGELPGDDTHESDQLRHHPFAPEIVQRWTELTDWCFKITIRMQ